MKHNAMAIEVRTRIIYSALAIMTAELCACGGARLRAEA